MKTFSSISQSDSRLFDFFRGGSALIVLVAHAYQILVAPQISDVIFNKIIFHIAGCAVMVFFFLSGFMVFSSLYRNASKKGFNEIDLKTFFVDRLIRLYPPLLFSFLITFLVYSLAKMFNIEYLSGHEFYILRDGFYLDSGLFGSLFFIQNMLDGYIGTPSLNASLWSLSHEFWFYVIGGILFKITFSPKRIKFLVPLFAIVIVMIMFGRAIPFFFGLMLWFLGGIVFIAHQNIKLKPTRYHLPVAVSLLLLSFYFSLSSNNSLYFLSKYIFGASFSVLIVYLLSLEVKSLGFLSNDKIFNYIADSSRYSYTSYVIHWPIYMLIYGVLGAEFASNYYINFLAFTISIIFIINISSRVASILENKKRIITILESYGYKHSRVI